jgi:hypothetical protein
MLAFDGTGDRAFSDVSSTCAGIARTGAAADQSAEPERHNRGISHAWNSCMRISSNPALLSDGKTRLSHVQSQQNFFTHPQFATLNAGRGQHRKYLPHAFTEHGALMTAMVLEYGGRSGSAVPGTPATRCLLGDC